jgi:hypothetical protein
VPPHKIQSSELDFIKTLEIHDVLLMECNHKVSELYRDNRKLHIDISKADENSIIVTEQFVVFEISVSLKIFDKEVNDENETKPLVESSAKFGAIYSYENSSDWDEDTVAGFGASFFRFSAITHMMAFAREHFYSVISKSGYPRLHIPLIKSLIDDEAEKVASEALQSDKAKE